MKHTTWIAGIVRALAVALALLAAACDSSDAGPSPGGGPATTLAGLQGPEPVIVQNTAQDPVPTAAVGTTTIDGSVAASQRGAWSVNVAGGAVAASQDGAWFVGAAQSGNWNVGATQQGAWAVDIASAPPVSLAAGASVAVSAQPPVSFDGPQPVEVTNMPSVTIEGFASVRGAVAITNEGDSPVPVHVVNSGSAATPTPWADHRVIVIDQNGHFASAALAIYTVPAGKRLVIEYIDAFMRNFNNGNGHGTRIRVNVDGPGPDEVYNVPFNVSQALTNFQHEAFAQVVKWYAEAGDTISLTAVRDVAQGITDAEITLSGYLIDVP